MKENLAVIEPAVVGPAREHARQRGHQAASGAGAIDLKKWVAAVDLSADRAGFVVANDLELCERDDQGRRRGLVGRPAEGAAQGADALRGERGVLRRPAAARASTSTPERAGGAVRRRIAGRADPGLLVAVALAVSAAALGDGCSATGAREPTSTGAGGGAANAASTVGVTGTGGAKAASTSASTGGGTGGGAGGGIHILPDAGDAGDADACDSQCGPTELCDPAHLGLDDNCNGEVDEGCPCNPGKLHWCFEGDPKYHGAPGCFDGTEACTELGTWGPCVGGVHASPPDDCYQNSTASCHAIHAAPFATVDLATGTGSFSANAVAGSASYAVACPSGVSQCPAVTLPSSFQPLQSGEYTVTYTKSVAGDPAPLSCTFPLFVERARPARRALLGALHDRPRRRPGSPPAPAGQHRPLGREPRRAAGLRLGELQVQRVLPDRRRCLAAVVPDGQRGAPARELGRPAEPREQHLLRHPSRHRAEVADGRHGLP